MKNKKKLFLWLYIPQDNKVQFDPYKSSLTQVKVECTFKRVIPNKHSSNVEYTYIHPRLNKKLTGIIPMTIWNTYIK